ncbi:MAG: hypothetical protein IIC82_05280 [Chloroflexi bacterium]|nr:hypothetical protein [Chloroflexota bacterium]
MSKQLEGRCLVHKNCDVAHTIPQVLQIADLRAENARLLALAERLKEALKDYGIHGLGCRYGLLPRGIHRQSFSPKENARLEKASIKECTCGFRDALALTPAEALEKKR